MGKRAGAGDIDAFETIYQLYSPGQVRIMRYQFGDFPPAEDLAQEAFTNALAAIGKNKFTYRGRGSTYSWLVRIAINAGINARRRSNRIAMLPTDFQDPVFDCSTPEDFTEEIAGQDYVDGLLSNLPPDFADVVKAVDLRGDSYLEHAQDKGIPRTTVGTRLFRGRAALRNIVEND